MSKTILITGASRGIGREIADYLAKLNHRVIITARSAKSLKNLEQSYPDHIQSVPADLSKTEDISNLIDYLDQNNLQLHGLINNAGVLINKPFVEQTNRDWQLQIDVNLMAPVRLIRATIPYLAEGSHIVNIGSMGGYQGSSKFPGLSAYSVTKGALSVLTECVATELSGYKISCNCLCLGAVYTEMLKEAFPGFEPPVTASDMGTYIGEFVLKSHTFYNGKILPVALSDPE